jgi:AAA domain
MNQAFRPGIWDNEPALLERPRAEWLLSGYLAFGKVTQLTSMWKSGKTTLVSLLLARRAQGGALAGLGVAPGKTAVLSEEEEDLWAERRRRLDFGGNLCLFSLPFDGRPNLDAWRNFLDHILELRRTQGVNLFVVDTIASFLPANENSARSVQDALQPLRRLTQQGLSVLLNHHPRKGEGPLGLAARGSGAFGGFADICVEMGHPGGNPETRRRVLRALSRFQETPRRLLIELNADATDYAVCEDAADDTDFRGNWDIVLMVLEDAHHPLTRRQILEEWPADFPKPCEQTLWEWLTRAATLGWTRVEGTGKKNDPFRYWLPAMQEKWKTDPDYQRYQNGRWLEAMMDQQMKDVRAKEVVIPFGQG